jgi:hypothetical protein
VARGIENRFKDYEEFRQFAVEKGMKEGDCIHRPDRDGHYSRENAEFVDEKEHRRISGLEKRKLSDNQVRECRALRKCGMSTYKIARNMPVSQRTVWLVVNGGAYADVV